MGRLDDLLDLHLPRDSGGRSRALEGEVTNERSGGPMNLLEPLLPKAERDEQELPEQQENLPENPETNFRLPFGFVKK